MTRWSPPPERHAPRYDADVHVLSYPKAGRTWLRALVGKVLVDHYGLNEERLLNVYALTQAVGLPVTAFDHDGAAMLNRTRWQDMRTDRSGYRGHRVLLLGRDIRDNLVSAYFQATLRINVFDGPISDFIRQDEYGVDKVLAFYRIWSANRNVPTAFEFLTYEDLHRDPAGALVRVLAFIGLTVPAAAIAAAVDYCRFENLRKAEAEDRFHSDVLRAGRDDHPESFKVRKGKVGNFTEYLSAEDIAYIDAAAAARGCEFTQALAGTRVPEARALLAGGSSR